jgi:hypothetical protein
MNVNTSPCPIERLIEHSAEHFISPAAESFEQLAARRAQNVGLLMRFLERMEAGSTHLDARVRNAFYLLGQAREELEAAAAGR